MTQKNLAEENSDFELRTLDDICINESELSHPWWYNFKYMVAGIFFGIVLIKGEVISWFRIQEMFHLQSFHMYGVIGSAIMVGALSVWIIKKLNARTIYGERITFYTKKFRKGQIIGGLLFGFGWAMTGACPGPLYALIGSGFGVIGVVLLSAIAGTWCYGLLKSRIG